jgi:signal transduction histidine kinase
MSGDRTIDYSHGLVALSLLLLAVPLFDMSDDVAAGKTPLSTLFENSIFLALTLGFLAAAVWLVRNDWEEKSVQLVARWSVFGTVAVAAVYGWVLGFQLFVQNDLKPYVIAADGIVIGGITLFVAGVYSARSQRERAAFRAQRDRFSALFDNTSDAIAVVRREGGTPVFEDVNRPFERTFGRERPDVVGRPVPESLSEFASGEGQDDLDEHGPTVGESLAAVVGDPDAQAEVGLRTPTSRQDFLVEYVPVRNGGGGRDGEPERPTGAADEATTGPGTGTDAGMGFLVFTDITAQRQRERQFETLSEGSEGLLGSRSVDEVAGVVHDLAGELFDTHVVGVWKDDGGTLVPAEADVDGGVDLPSVPAGDGGVAVATDADEDVADAGSDRLRAALAGQGVGVDSLLARRLSDRHVLVLGRRGANFSATDRYLADVLATNARTATERVDREAELARRGDQLEFVNSLLRHDIQNAMTVIRSRSRVLAESASGREREYAETIAEQSNEITELVDRFRALLDALTDSGDATLEPVSLSSVLRERVATFETTFEEAEVTTEIPDGVEVEADEMLTNLFGNVLRNAVEHNDGDEPRVSVRVDAGEEVATVRIADNGPGIPEDKREVIFRRGNRGLKEADIGSGFGLFFVDTMMERYGGDVAVEDNDPHGTVFVLTFRTTR